MRNAEARVALGVTAAREGDLEQALVWASAPSKASASPSLR